jgi:plastocyanin
MKKVVSLLALALAAIALVACGGDDDNDTSTATEGGGATTTESSGEKAGGGSAGGSALSFEADPEGALAYTTTEATASAGKVTVEFNNPQTAPHDVAFEDSGGEEVGKTDLITDSSTSTTVDLKPGEYTFYCTVPGHREAGMEGTLTVK